MFPPHVTPPGVFVSEDRAEVCAPHSLAGSLLLLAIILLTVSDICCVLSTEWFISYYAEAKSRFGPNAKEKGMRNIMQEGICRAGEIFFVPQGWWHSELHSYCALSLTLLSSFSFLSFISSLAKLQLTLAFALFIFQSSSI
jgi:hypothetical protein